MKRVLPLVLLTALLPATATVCATDAGLLNNPSFEERADGDRPEGWQMFANPKETVGEFYVADGTAGQNTHTGSSAVQFHFPDGAELVQAVWTGNVNTLGTKATPGRYTCSFWVKGEDLLDGFHTWLSIVAYGPNGTRLKEFARSDYLKAKQLPEGEWKQITFTFEIPKESEVEQIAPTLVFKTHPESVATHVPNTTRVLVDDIELTRK